FLLGAALICQGLAVYSGAEELGEALGLAIAYGVLYGIAAGLARIVRNRIRHVDAASLLILWLPALFLYLSWLERRSSSVAAIGTMFLRMAIVVGVFNLAKTRSGRRRIGLRKDLASARGFFQRELASPTPRLSDDWFPYVLAFGLSSDAERWFKA